MKPSAKASEVFHPPDPPSPPPLSSQIKALWGSLHTSQVNSPSALHPPISSLLAAG